MHAAAENSKNSNHVDDDSAALGIAYAFGGFVVGVLTTGFSLVAMGFAIVIAQGITGKNVCLDGFSAAVSNSLVVFGVFITIFMGRALLRGRRFIGTKGGDASDIEFGAMLRRRFTYGSMITYCLLAPFSLLFIYGAANCVR